MAKLTFHMTADPHARDVMRENPAKGGVIDGSTTKIGSIQWHPDRRSRFVPHNDTPLTMFELEAITQRLRRETEGSVRRGEGL
jgi:hypothetical protein